MDSALDAPKPFWIGQFVGEQVIEWGCHEPLRGNLEEAPRSHHRFQGGPPLVGLLLVDRLSGNAQESGGALGGEAMEAQQAGQVVAIPIRPVHAPSLSADMDGSNALA
jgi:hypothetical protein